MGVKGEGVRTAVAAHGPLKCDVCEHIAGPVEVAPEAGIVVDLAGPPCRPESVVRGEIGVVEERRPPAQLRQDFGVGIVEEPVRVSVLARYKQSTREAGHQRRVLVKETTLTKQVPGPTQRIPRSIQDSTDTLLSEGLPFGNLDGDSPSSSNN